MPLLLATLNAHPNQASLAMPRGSDIPTLGPQLESIGDEMIHRGETRQGRSLQPTSLPPLCHQESLGGTPVPTTSPAPGGHSCRASRSSQEHPPLPTIPTPSHPATQAPRQTVERSRKMHPVLAPTRLPSSLIGIPGCVLRSWDGRPLDAACASDKCVKALPRDSTGTPAPPCTRHTSTLPDP